MQNLKGKIINENETKIEQVENLVDNYKSTQCYMEDNYEKIPEERLKNMQYKQNNRKEQIESLSKNIYNDKK